jgi:hypothetical protein
MVALWLVLACIPRPADRCVRTYGDNCDCEPMCVPAWMKRAIEQGPQCDMQCDAYFDSGATWSCAVERDACVVVWNE